MHGLKSPFKFVVGNEDHTVIGTTPQDDTAMPTMANGDRPKYVACVHDGGITANERALIKIAFGETAVAVLVTTGFPIPANEVVVFDVSGFDVYAIVGLVAGMDFTIVPLENF